MAESRTEAVLFDIDGTLIDTGGASDRAWRRAFEELYDVAVEIDKHTGAGMTDPQVGLLAFRTTLGREPSRREFAQLMAQRLRFLPDEVERSPGFRTMPGVEPLLEQLIDQGVLLGLTTGNVEAAAHIKLSRARLNAFFSFGGYGSDSSDRIELTKRALERARTVAGSSLEAGSCMAVGDTPHDVDAGHGAGIVVVGVATGQFSVEQLRDAGADHTVRTLERGLPL